MELVVYCADIGSVTRGRFGWARSEERGQVRSHRGGTEIVDLVEKVATDLGDGRAVALGFECPLFVPVPEQPLRLGAARAGDGARSWSAAAGAGALTTGLVQVAWVLSELRKRAPATAFYLDWSSFEGAGSGLLLWEAFVTDGAKGDSHIDDATIAALAFRQQVRAPNAVSAERPLSLVGMALLWSGWSTDLSLLHSSCVVIKPPPRPITPSDVVSDPTVQPRAHRDQREVSRKLTLLDAPHMQPLTAFVRRLRDQRGPDSVPWFDPSEGGIDARILLCLENPGRRADAVHGSGFISPDNNDPTAENMWHILREAGIDRSQLVTTNIVPWYLGDADRIGKVTSADLGQARTALLELLTLLPRLHAVVLLGRQAQRGWDRAAPTIDIPVLRTPHPSSRWLNTHPADRERIIEQLREANRLATN